SSRRCRTSNPSRSSRNGPDSPPSYSVEENSDGEWVSYRTLPCSPIRSVNTCSLQRSYLSYDDSSSDGKRSERRSKKKRSKREKKESEKGTRSLQKKSSARSPVSTEKESQYITLSGSETDDVREGASSSKRIRRERKRNVVQTSPQVSRRSRNGLTTDDDDKKIDSIVFDTRSAMMRYKESEDILPAMRRTRSKKKKPSAADQRENEEYNRYYVGVKSRRGVEKELNKPGEFALYYEKPREGEMPAAVSLKIAYRSSTAQAYHFPIQAFEGTDGHNHYVVMQNKSDGKMFTSILSLVKHYSLYSHVDTSTGRLETFSIPH
ncbi:hypothetical protein PMAYCL1PPCAC_21125, partial [Pristionchus mayeri]